MKNLSQTKAVILAGGEGSRLRPITCKLPKPLAPIMAEPTMAHILRLVSRHGVKEAIVTTHYLCDMIPAAFGKEFAGVSLCYHKETTPLGTAGGVKAASEGIDGEFIVISGDAMCDFDLSAALAFHREKKSEATIIVYPSSEVGEYGVVTCDASARVTGFIEKPSVEQSFSDLVNTGIYIFSEKILEKIPSDTPYDFAKDLFSKMLSEGRDMYVWRADGYWCDIGSISAFYRCNMDMLERSGRPSFISEHAEIDADAEIGDGCIIGAGCKIGAGAKLSGCILFDDVCVMEDAVIDSSIICNRVTVQRGARIPRGCVIGDGSVIGQKVSFSNDILVWNDKHIGAKAEVCRDIVFGKAQRRILGDDGICGVCGEDFDSSYAAKIGSAAAAAAEGRLGFSHDGSPAAKAFCAIMANSALIKGAEVCITEACPECVAAKSAGDFDISLMLHVSQNCKNEIKVCLFDKNGLYPERRTERTIESEIAHPKTEAAAANKIRDAIFIDGVEDHYCQGLLSEHRRLGTDLSGLSVCTSDNATSRCFARIASGLGATVYVKDKVADGRCVYIDISGDGYEFCASSVLGDSVYLADRWHIIAGIMSCVRDMGCDIIGLPYIAPEAILRAAEAVGIDTVRYARSPASCSSDEKAARSLASKQIFLRDGIAACLYLCRRLSHEKKNVGDILRELPDFYVCFDEMEARDEDKTYIMRALCEAQSTSELCGEGVRLNFGYGDVHVLPRRDGGLAFLADAYDAEMAEDIIGRSKEQIKKLLDGRE